MLSVMVRRRVAVLASGTICLFTAVFIIEIQETLALEPPPRPWFADEPFRRPQPVQRPGYVAQVASRTTPDWPVHYPGNTADSVHVMQPHLRSGQQWVSSSAL